MSEDEEDVRIRRDTERFSVERTKMETYKKTETWRVNVVKEIGVGT